MADKLELGLPTPTFQPAALGRLLGAFDDERFLFELKHDGFRALAHITEDGCQLIPRRGNVYKSFGALARSLSDLGPGISSPF